MLNTYLFYSVTFIYLAAAIFYFAYIAWRREGLGKIAAGVTGAGFLIQTAALIIRWVESYRLGFGHAPLTNFYESLVFFSWSVALVYLWTERRYRLRSAGAPVMLIAFLLSAYPSLSPHISSEVQPLMPALKSNWLISHVITCFLSYAAFTVSMAASLLYLGRRRKEKKDRALGKLWELIPAADVLDDISYRMISLGFPLLTIGILTGAAWADRAWGSYWSWDPKETWALITWLIYAAFLHARLTLGWKGSKAAWLALLGFLAMLITYIGVNRLPIFQGLHSYI